MCGTSTSCNTSPLDSRVKHENDGKEGGTGMTCLLQAGGMGSKGTLPFDYAQGKL